MAQAILLQAPALKAPVIMAAPIEILTALSAWRRRSYIARACQHADDCALELAGLYKLVQGIVARWSTQCCQTESTNGFVQQWSWDGAVTMTAGRASQPNDYHEPVTGADYAT